MKDVVAQVEENFQTMRATLQSCLRSDGTPRPSTTPQQAVTSNKQCTPVQGPICNLQGFTSADVKDYIIGDQVITHSLIYFANWEQQFQVDFYFRSYMPNQLKILMYTSHFGEVT